MFLVKEKKEEHINSKLININVRREYTTYLLNNDLVFGNKKIYEKIFYFEDIYYNNKFIRNEFKKIILLFIYY